MLNKLVDFIDLKNNVHNKSRLAELVTREFNCVKDGKAVYYTNCFAIRFCQADSLSFSNTVLSLSKLQKHDSKPFIVCICTPDKNEMLLANTSFLCKISHSSQELRVDNIKGSFNGSDIIREIDGIKNIPANFNTLFAIHQNFTFEENLERLVAATNHIVPTGRRFDVNVNDRLVTILDAPQRASNFSDSSDYTDLFNDLNERTNRFKNEIIVAACIENVNLRGRIIEYLIAGEDMEMRNKLIQSLKNKFELPRLVTRDGLGDYGKNYPNYLTETDIKTKIMVLSSAPKGYNLDKMLEFLSQEKTVFMIFLVGIDYEQGDISTKLVSMFHKSLVENTVIQSHWAGRNSRGVSQFNGEAIKEIILNEQNTVDLETARKFLKRIIEIY